MQTKEQKSIVGGSISDYCSKYFIFVVVLLIAGCATKDTAVSNKSVVGVNVTAATEMAIEPNTVECQAQSQEILDAVPPPLPVHEGQVVTSPPQLCPEGFAPRLAAVKLEQFETNISPYTQSKLRALANQAKRTDEPVISTTQSESGESLVLPTTAGPDYYYAGVIKPSPADRNQGVGARVLISNPSRDSTLDMVTSQMSVVKGNNTHLVETGMRKFWSEPTLMIARWKDGDFKDAASSTNPGSCDTVTGWCQVHNTYRPNMSLSAYVGQAVNFYIRRSGSKWWVYFNDAWVGYFPDSHWNNRFTAGDMSHFYGEVFDASMTIPPKTDMGGGVFPGQTGATFIDGMCQHSAAAACYVVHHASRNETNSAYYKLSYNGANNYFWFGGPGGD